jgi:NADPH-dependent curcumin reductase CurA
MMNKTILLEKRPVGKPTIDSFKFVEEAMPQPKNGEVLLKTTYVSVDPYLRGRMNSFKSYIAPFNLNEPVKSGIVAEVLESKNSRFSKGDFVAGMLDWSEYQLSNGTGLITVNSKISPLSVYQGILGMPGLTAHLGFTEIGQPKSGETLVVSGAAGAVGLIVGQIGKLLGCKVVGITGSDEKVELLKSEFGFDEAINYKTSKHIYKSIAEACPDGVDVYFDNVGGEISDGVIMNINKFARIIICGAISQYNETRIPMGPRLQGSLLVKSALMKGFIVNDYADKFPASIKQLTEWFLEGKLKNKETVVEGFENIPEAFIGLFEGSNIGKMMVKV